MRPEKGRATLGRGRSAIDESPVAIRSDYRSPFPGALFARNRLLSLQARQRCTLPEGLATLRKAHAPTPANEAKAWLGLGKTRNPPVPRPWRGGWPSVPRSLDEQSDGESSGISLLTAFVSIPIVSEFNTESSVLRLPYNTS